MIPQQKQTFLVLGTALWGWAVNADRARGMLCRFYEQGGQWVDTASNYPIDKIPDNFGRAELMLSENLRDQRFSDLKLICKVGGLTNNGSAECDLSPAFLAWSHGRLRTLFGPYYRCLMIHWDDRNQAAEIGDTLHSLADIRLQGYEIGLSGIRHPVHYAGRIENPLIEIKHNFKDSDEYLRYSDFQGNARFLAYGLTMGGVRLDGSYSASSSASLRGIVSSIDSPKYVEIFGSSGAHPAWPRNLTQMGMLFAHNTPDVAGLILGPSTVEQLQDSLDYHGLLNVFDTEELAREMARMLGTKPWSSQTGTIASEARSESPTSR